LQSRSSKLTISQKQRHIQVEPTISN